VIVESDDRGGTVDYWWQVVLPSIITLLLGVGVSEWYHRRGKEVREIVWATWNFPIVRRYSTTDPFITLRYQEEQITSIGVSWIAIWNNGKKAISSSDFTQRSPMKIVLTQGAEVLSAHIAGASDPGNVPDIEIDAERRSIKFTTDYLNFRQGFVLSILHTEPGSGNISVSGVVVNGMPPKQIRSSFVDLKSIPRFAFTEEWTGEMRSGSRQTKRNIAVAGVAFLATTIGVGVQYGVQTAVFTAFSIFSAFMVLSILLVYLRVRVGKQRVNQPIGLDELNDVTLSPNYWDRRKQLMVFDFND
jgi:membrane protein implicated in regulation of membrane protease activity